MTRWNRIFLVVMLLLVVANVVEFVRARALHDLLAAAGFALMAWGFWRNPRGFRDAHGNDVTVDRRAARLSLVGAGVVAAAMLLQLVAGFALEP